MTDRTPKCVKDVLDKPGRYRFDGQGLIWFFEVDTEGNVYQLKPDAKTRDGFLSKDGWNPSADYGRVTSIDAPKEKKE